MVKILENKKRVFWEALFLTVVVFVFGILIGVGFESNRIDKIQDYYSRSEISVMDIFTSGNIVELGIVNCSILEKSNFEFADRIYSEAVLLEKYEDSGKITEGMKIEHERYDLLRTLLWINEIKTVQECGRNYHTVVYLYEYQPEDLAQRATQDVWSKILSDLKTKYGNEVLLIPVAVDSGIISLDSLIKEYNVTSYSAVIINNKNVLYELSSVEELEKYLN